MTSVAPKHSAPDSSIPRVERSWTVNDVLREYPSVAPVFKTFGIHTCCGGTRTLDEAARQDGVDLAALVAALEWALYEETPR